MIYIGHHEAWNNARWNNGWIGMRVDIFVSFRHVKMWLKCVHHHHQCERAASRGIEPQTDKSQCFQRSSPPLSIPSLCTLHFVSASSIICLSASSFYFTSFLLLALCTLECLSTRSQTHKRKATRRNRKNPNDWTCSILTDDDWRQNLTHFQKRNSPYAGI